MFRSLNSTLQDLQQDLRDMKGPEGKITLSNQWKESVDVGLGSVDDKLDNHQFCLDVGLGSVDDKLDNHQFCLDVLTNMVIYQSKK